MAADVSITASGPSQDFAPPTHQLTSSGELVQEEVVDFCPPQAQRVLLPDGVSRSDAIFILSKGIPTNQFGFPLFFYRSDLLPADLNALVQSDVDHCAIELFYSDGYPTLDNGTPFWEQMPHEPFADYLLFKRFLDQAEDTGIRQLHLLAADQMKPLELCLARAREYYWSIRAKAYDLFVVAAEQKKREHRIRLTEGRHYQMAKDLMDSLLVKFDDPEWVGQLTTAEALDYLEKLVKIQRVSLGLSGTNASTLSKDAAPGVSVELLMRNLSKNGMVPQEDAGDFKDQLDILLNDPEAGAVAQELILRVTSGKSA